MEIKTVKNYYTTILELFPNIDKKDIEQILNYGCKSLYLHNSYGGDVLISDNDFWCYFGNLRKDSLQHFKYYIKKLCLKLRVLYNKKKIPWDGYYYFALTNLLQENVNKLKSSRGRKRKTFNYGNLILYKLKEECEIREYNRKYIYKVPYISELGYTFYKKNYITNKAELIMTRDSLKFKDILITNNKYELL